jgi:hypothetical protein
MSNDTPFYLTRMGRTYYEGTMPRLADAVERLAKAIDFASAAGLERGAGELALDAIAARLDQRVWTPDDLSAIAAIVRATGRAIRDVE